MITAAEEIKEMDEMTLTLNSPITEEQLDHITDVDFDRTDRIWFHTKHGKDVEFVKQRKGKWIGGELGCCSICGHEGSVSDIWNGCEGMFCPNCGVDMRGDKGNGLDS